MLEKTHYYPGQKSREEIVLFIRRHWFAYVKWAILLAFLIIVPIIILSVLFGNGTLEITDANKYRYITLSASYILILLAIFLTTWIDWYLDATIITRAHLINIKQNEIFTRTVAEQSLLRVQDVSSKMNGFFQSFFRFGTVNVETAGEQPNFKMINIPNPHVVASTIMQIHEELVKEHELGSEMEEGVGMDVLRRVNEPKKEFTPKPSAELIDSIYQKKDKNVPKEKTMLNVNDSLDQNKVISIQDPEKKKEKEDFPASEVKTIPSKEKPQGSPVVLKETKLKKPEISQKDIDLLSLNEKVKKMDVEEGELEEWQ